MLRAIRASRGRERVNTLYLRSLLYPSPCTTFQTSVKRFYENKSLQKINEPRKYDMPKHRDGLYNSSLASFIVLGGGGGGKTPNCTDRKKKSCNLCASERSERAPQKHIYFQVKYTGSKYICIQSIHFAFITYGMTLCK